MSETEAAVACTIVGVISFLLGFTIAAVIVNNHDDGYYQAKAVTNGCAHFQVADTLSGGAVFLWNKP